MATKQDDSGGLQYNTTRQTREIMIHAADIIIIHIINSQTLEGDFRVRRIEIAAGG